MRKNLRAENYDLVLDDKFYVPARNWESSSIVFHRGILCVDVLGGTNRLARDRWPGSGAPEDVNAVREAG